MAEVYELIEEVSPHYRGKKAKKEKGSETEVPGESHEIIYDSYSETLEPVYYWILDFLGQEKTEKLVDNFVSSPGGGHFEEMMRRAQTMQQMGTKVLGDVNTVIKSIINIIYDLKEWEIRLANYDAAKLKSPGDKEKAEAAMLALKQIWMDNVDIKRGRGSINMLAQDLNFLTIRNAFMATQSVEDVEKLDLNDIVKRVLKPRVQEFFQWKEMSEKENRKRYEIERSYLRSQVNALKLYTRWARPYLKAASELEQKESGGAALVKAFNTIILELTLLKKEETKIKEAILNKRLPASFKNAKVRKYYSCILVDFRFRGIPQKVGQHYVFGGRAKVSFRAYSLNEDEVNMLKQKMDESDVSEALKLVEGVTKDSLGQLQEDIDHYLKQEDESKKKEQQKAEGNINPFAALLGKSSKTGGKEEKKTEKKEPIKEVKPDTYEEKMLRAISETDARAGCFKVFDIYKKSHGMASHPSPEFDTDYSKVGWPEILKLG